MLRNHYVIVENTRMSHHRSLIFLIRIKDPYESFSLLRNDYVIVFVQRNHYVAGEIRDMDNEFAEKKVNPIREFTINSLGVSRIHYEFSIFVANKL